MDITHLRAAHEFAVAYGFKSLVYGAAGTGKTPLINTATRPLLLACEPGLLSMRGSQVPTYQADTVPKIEEFFKWFLNSKEANNFDTLAVDSISFMCDMYLEDGKKRGIKHGMQLYGDMAEKVSKHLQDLYFYKNKHMYLICKEENLDVNGANYKRPYFPGKVLPASAPGQYDAILYLCKAFIPGVHGEQLAFRCNGGYDVMARNRTGLLSDYEPPNFSELVRKAMG